MTGKTHITVGVATGLTLAIGYPKESQAILIAAAVVGSLIPDLDHPRSKINQRVLLFKNKLFKMITYSLMGLVLIYLDYVLYASGNKTLRLIGLALILIGISRHRGFTHSLLGLILFSSIVYIGTMKFNLYEAFIGFAIGYASHLFMDLLTEKGIYLLFPVDKRVRIPLGIKTSGFEEYIILMVTSIYSLYIISRHI